MLFFDQSSRIRRRLHAPMALVFGALMLWFVIESLIYRSGAYFQIASTQSNTGSVVNSLLMLEGQYRPGRTTVLVLGDSRVAEGFSGPLASAGSDIDFINISVPGSTPRTWYYLLREVFRRGYRIDAVALGINHQIPASRLSDWALSPNQDIALLGLRDTLSYPDSFLSDGMRARGRQALLFPAVTMRQDTLALLAAPGQRWTELHRVRPGYLAAVPGYPGRDSRMPELHLSAAAEVIDWGNATAEQRAQVGVMIGDQLLASDPETLALNREYLRRWLGKTARLMRQQQSRLVAFPLPRAPYPTLLAEQPGPTVAEVLSSVPGLHSLLPAEIRELERPEYFFDMVHANRAGRERISTVVSHAVQPLIGPG